ncbi:MAG: integrase DNA-binding domain-containing protein [Eubacterium sp.]|nr:integrase DNA-binding domain-containing protein [Eubacterium sp.]
MNCNGHYNISLCIFFGEVHGWSGDFLIVTFHTVNMEACGFCCHACSFLQIIPNTDTSGYKIYVFCKVEDRKQTGSSAQGIPANGESAIMPPAALSNIIERRGLLWQKRKDNQGRILRTGESQRKDGRYQFRYTDAAGKRHCVYALNSVDLREKKKGILRDLENGIRSSGSKKITLNDLVEIYLENHRSIRKVTEISYCKAINAHIKDSFIGNKPIANIRNSDMIKFYNSVPDKGISSEYLHIIHAFSASGF